MTYLEVIEMRDNLNKVNYIEGANARFLYAVAINKAKLEVIIKAMNIVVEPTPDILFYQKELDRINLRYAEKDQDGTVGYVIHPTFGRAFRKIVGDGNASSPYMKEVASLKETFSEEIARQEAKNRTYKDLLKMDLPAEEFQPLKIDLEIVPAGLHPLGMQGCISFIKESSK